MKLLQRLWKEESGQGLVEYGLLIVLIIVVAVAALSLFGDQLSELFGGIGQRITDAEADLTPAE